MDENQLKQAGYRKYGGEGIDVYYNIDICEHAGNCVKGSIEVFNPKRKPWVLPDAKPAEEVARIVETCPTRALRYVMQEETQHESND